MICKECNKNKAEWILDDAIVSHKFLLVCQDCLDEMIHQFGDSMLDYWSINLGLEAIFDAVNERLTYWRDMYLLALNGEIQSYEPKKETENNE